MKIALDAMGGDYAPLEIIKGALQFAKTQKNGTVVLVGKERTISRILNKLDKHGKYSSRFEIVDATENIAMSEHPVEAVRKKKDCSINVGLKLVRTGEAEAFISAGNTGAVMAASLFTLGRLKKVDRPALVNTMPSTHGPVVFLDLGANADCKPAHLVQFAKMGKAYAETVLKKKNPRVGLLNIGEEDEKGCDLSINANALLKKEKKINFVGNVEGKDFFIDKADVIVTDGFTGNVILKYAEGMVSFFKKFLTKGMKHNPLALLGGLLMFVGLKKQFKQLDYREYGGAPLLGVKGVSFITHGRAKAKTIKSALIKAKEAADNDLLGSIRAQFE
jgi:glycerol-3-phosphate acyltransferase PlsX